MSEHLLCRLEELTEPGSKGFEIDPGDGGAPLAGFVVRKAGQVFAYRNSCPHTGAPLEWLPDQFLDMGNGFIQCALHGALFVIEDGRCLRGPCVGDYLQPLKVALRGAEVWLLL